MQLIFKFKIFEYIFQLISKSIDIDVLEDFQNLRAISWMYKRLKIW